MFGECKCHNVRDHSGRCFTKMKKAKKERDTQNDVFLLVFMVVNKTHIHSKSNLFLPSPLHEDCLDMVIQERRKVSTHCLPHFFSSDCFW